MPTGDRTPILEADSLRKRYVALVVLDDVAFTLGADEAVGIVGPNGAGKTTLLNVLAGSQRPNGGRGHFRGSDVTTAGAAKRSRLGIGRAHQVPRPFGGMTVFENVFVPATAGGGHKGQDAYDRCIDVLETCHLLELSNRPAESLGLLHRKRLEHARALSTDPAVLLLDEIGGGLTDGETSELVETIRVVHRQGVAIVWIEHIVHVLVQVVHRLVCMDAGRVIADGEPAAVMARRRDRRVSRGQRLMPVLAVEHLGARHGLLQAVRDVSFSIDEGETLALVGANGAGKTTMLRTIAGAHRLSLGGVEGMWLQA